MKKIAVITGASSGMGRRFAETVDTFGRFDERYGSSPAMKRPWRSCGTRSPIPSAPWPWT